MHFFLLRKLFLFFGVVVVVTQALSVTVPDKEGRYDVRISDSQNGATTPILEARIPRRSRGRSKGGSRRPTKSKPEKKPERGAKPNPGAKQKPGARPKQETKPSTKASSVIFPKLKVPYVDIAIDLCGIYIDCVDRDAGKPNGFTVNVKRPSSDSRKHTLTVRARKPGGLAALNYPESSILYTGPRSSNPKEIFRFQNTHIGSTAVRSFTSVLSTETYGSNYATEHIIELQTISMFRDWAKKREPKLEDFFETKWDQKYPFDKIKARHNKPNYIDEQNNQPRNQQRRSLNALVFEAMGSTVNPRVFVLLQNEINLYKKQLWTFGRPMENEKFEKALSDAWTGARPSSEYLSAIRTVFGVFSYLSTPAVHEKMVNINENVIKELRNAVQITGAPVAQNLASMWQTFLEEKFDNIDAWAKKWTGESIDIAQKGLKTTLAKYEKMFQEREKAELQAQKEVKAGKGSKGKGKAPASYAEEQKQKHKALSTKLAQHSKDMRAHRAELRTLRATQKANANNWTKDEKSAQGHKIKEAKKDIENAEEAFGRTQREIHELYSYSVKMIIKNLKKDQQRLLSFKKKIRTLNMPRL